MEQLRRSCIYIPQPWPEFLSTRLVEVDAVLGRLLIITSTGCITSLDRPRLCVIHACCQGRPHTARYAGRQCRPALDVLRLVT